MTDEERMLLLACAAVCRGVLANGMLVLQARILPSEADRAALEQITAGLAELDTLMERAFPGCLATATTQGVTH